MQHLKEKKIESLLHFAHWGKTNPAFNDLFWFSDESHFYSNSAINKKNCRLLGTEKPEYHLKKSLQSEKLILS